MALPVRKIEGLPVCQLEGAERAYYGYKRKPVSEYPLLARLLIRFLYRRYGWNTDDGSVESVGIFTSEEIAREVADKEGWGFQELPVNQPLPEETCQFGLNDFPKSDARKQIVNRRLGYVAVPRHVIRTLEKANTRAREAERT